MIKIGFLVLMAVIYVANADNVPVLMFQKTKSLDQADNTVTIGQSLKSDSFLKQLSSIKNAVDIILLDELNDQDLRGLLQEELSESMGNIHYEPAVESAYPILKSYLDKNQLKVNVEDFKMDVTKALEVFKNRQTTSDVVVLVGLKSRETKPESRISKRQVEDQENEVNAPESMTVFGDGCAAMFDSIYFLDNSIEAKRNKRVDLAMSSSVFTCTESQSSLKLTVTSNQTLFDATIKEVNMDFVRSPNTQYWKLRNGTVVTSLESIGLTYMGAPYAMETPNMFSFVCTKTYFQLFNATESTRPPLKANLYIEMLQIQPTGVENNGTDFTFGKVNYCQGFFTSGIWMAILSSLLLVFITVMGVSFLAGINTMDRFDDPKGKPLNIALEK